MRLICTLVRGRDLGFRKPPIYVYPQWACVPMSDLENCPTGWQCKTLS